MKRDCAKFMKLQKSSTFMAMIEEYEPEEIEYLDLLICTTNRKVCKWCLDKSCNGACPEVSPSMTSAKRKFFENGAYELVLTAKMDRQSNKFGHSAFSRDSYLSTRPSPTPEGANSEDDEQTQEDISIMGARPAEDSDGAPSEKELHLAQDDESSVDEDGNSLIA